VRVVLWTCNQAGAPDKLYAKVFPSLEMKVVVANWKAYASFTRATVGTCELKGNVTCGNADTNAVKKTGNDMPRIFYVSDAE
jgi:hypothetical protein